jgi:hypothetical protein
MCKLHALPEEAKRVVAYHSYPKQHQHQKGGCGSASKSR